MPAIAPEEMRDIWPSTEGGAGLLVALFEESFDEVKMSL
jgi:hypothetical protein